MRKATIDKFPPFSTSLNLGVIHLLPTVFLHTRLLRDMPVTILLQNRCVPVLCYLEPDADCKVSQNSHVNDPILLKYDIS